MARLDIDFAAHVRPTADMLWSRIAKARVLDIARTVFGLTWASARSKYKKPALAKAMEAAFATGNPPVGVSAAMYAAALAWVPPGFAAFDTGRTVGDAGHADVGAGHAATATAGNAATATAGNEPADGTETVEPAVDAYTVPPAANGDGHAPEPEAGPSDGDAADAGRGDTGATDPDPAVAGGPDGIATTGPIPPVPANGHDAIPDPMEIPEFLRRVQ